MGYQWDFSWVWRYRAELLGATGVSLLLTLCAVTAGCAFGIALFLLRTSRSKSLCWVARAAIEVFRDLPVLVVMVWLFYCLPLVLGDSFRFSPFSIAAAALALNFGALEAEIVRAGFEAIPPVEIEVAKGFGFTRLEITRNLILPQSFWRSLAPTLGQVVNTVKLSSLASFVAVPEAFYRTGELIQVTYRPLEFYSALGVLYLLIILPTSLVLQRLERALRSRFDNA